MSYNAKVYKVFIASPNDVTIERNVIRSVLARWNAINSESQKTVLLPVGWDTHAAPESGKEPQQYINEHLLDKCDILIGVFWSRVGNPTKKYESGTIEEISRHIQERKLAMLYFSQKPYPQDADLEKKLYNHLEIKMTENKFRPTFDSDI